MAFNFPEFWSNCHLHKVWYFLLLKTKLLTKFLILLITRQAYTLHVHRKPQLSFENLLSNMWFNFRQLRLKIKKKWIWYSSTTGKRNVTIRNCEFSNLILVADAAYILLIWMWVHNVISSTQITVPRFCRFILCHTFSRMVEKLFNYFHGTYSNKRNIIKLWNCIKLNIKILD